MVYGRREVPQYSVCRLKNGESQRGDSAQVWRPEDRGWRCWCRSESKSLKPAGLVSKGRSSRVSRLQQREQTSPSPSLSVIWVLSAWARPIHTGELHLLYAICLFKWRSLLETPTHTDPEIYLLSGHPLAQLNGHIQLIITSLNCQTQNRPRSTRREVSSGGSQHCVLDLITKSAPRFLPWRKIQRAREWYKAGREGEQTHGWQSERTKNLTGRKSGLNLIWQKVPGITVQLKKKKKTPVPVYNRGVVKQLHK